MNEWESYMGIKPLQSDAIGHLKGLRMTLVKSPDYIKTVQEKLKYPFLESTIGVHTVSTLFSTKFQFGLV